MKELYLNKKGKYALVDDDDYDALKRHNWFCHNQGYAFRHQSKNLKPRSVYLHNQLMKPEKGFQVSFKDRNPLNCQRDNLRVLSLMECRKLARPRKDKKCPYKGVSLMNSKKYRAVICFDGHDTYLGVYKTAKEAAIAYDEAALHHFGQEAYLNFPHHAFRPESEGNTKDPDDDDQ